MRRHPTRHLNRQEREVDARRFRTELGLQPRPPGIHRQQGELDLDAGLLLEGRRNLLDQGALPRSLVLADEDKLFRLALGPSRSGRGGKHAARRALQQMPSLQTSHGVPSIFLLCSRPDAAAYLPYYTILTCSSLANAIGNFASGPAHHP